MLDPRTVTIDGRRYAIDTADIGKKGRSGIGADKRTAEYTGGGAAPGAVIGAIKAPAESALTVNLDKPPKVAAVR
jgi:hypothetical protein